MYCTSSAQSHGKRIYRRMCEVQTIRHLRRDTQWSSTKQIINDSIHQFSSSIRINQAGFKKIAGGGVTMLEANPCGDSKWPESPPTMAKS